MYGKEPNLYFSTKSDGVIKDYGDSVVRVEIPLEKLKINDLFDDEVHLTMEVKPYKMTSIKFSKKNSLGEQLTKEQIEFFKDSKVLDENGNLLVVYHGTKNGGFTEFSKEKIRSGVTLYANNGDGFYFTENKIVADKYGKNNSLYSVYLNLENPFVFIEADNQEALKILNNFAKKRGIDEKYDWKDYVSASERTGTIMGYYIKSGEGFSEYLQSLGYDGIIYNSYN